MSESGSVTDQVGDRVADCGQLPVKHSRDRGLARVQNEVVQAVVAVREACREDRRVSAGVSGEGGEG